MNIFVIQALYLYINSLMGCIIFFRAIHIILFLQPSATFYYNLLLNTSFREYKKYTIYRFFFSFNNLMKKKHTFQFFYK